MAASADRRGRARLAVVALASSSGAAGCGAPMPLLHPVHVLGPGRVEVGAGASTTRTVRASSEATASSATALTDGQLHRATAELVRDEVAPWLGARVGVGGDTEVDLSSSIRALRLGGRHAWDFGAFGVSAGAGLDGILPRPASAPARAGDAAVDTDAAHGLGFDVPLLVGVRSDGDILRAWLGARGGYRWLSGPVVVRDATGTETRGTLGGGQWSAGGLVGLAAGLRPIWVAVELDVAMVGTHASFDVDGTHHAATTHGVAFVPAGALFTKF